MGELVGFGLEGPEIVRSPSRNVKGTGFKVVRRDGSGFRPLHDGVRWEGWGTSEGGIWIPFNNRFHLGKWSRTRTRKWARAASGEAYPAGFHLWNNLPGEVLDVARSIKGLALLKVKFNTVVAYDYYRIVARAICPVKVVEEW